MKVNELREKLSKLKKEEIVQIASEFYKLIPKSKKEDYDLDSYINNPSKRQKKSKPKAMMSLAEIEVLINEFIEDAKEQYYLIPNRKVPKKERSTWRFKVKRWYKNLINTQRSDKDLVKQSNLLLNLYELICESCGYQYFSGYDSFQSIGIEQLTFYRSVIALKQESQGKLDSVRECIELIVNNYLNRYTLYSMLMRELLSTFETVDLKKKGIEVVEGLILDNGFTQKKRDQKYHYYSTKDFLQREKNNNLSELGLRLYISLYEIEEGILFYEKYYHENEEVKLYILIRILFELRKKEEIVKQLENSLVKGIKPRKNLLNLLKEIKSKGELPDYMR